MKTQDQPHSSSPGSTSADKTQIHATKTDKQRRELWMYLAVSIIAIEFLVFVAALLFSFISSTNGQPKFPWLSWTAAAITIPCIMLVAVHLAVGLFTSSSSQDEEWQKHLPERIQRAYAIIKRAPAIVFFLGIISIGVALFTLDGALQAIESLFMALRPYILHILIGVGLVIVTLGLGALWLNYRTRKLYAEYEYRQAVLQKTGLIIVDKGSFILSGDHPALTPIAAESAKALPPPSPPSDNANKDDDIIDAGFTEVDDSLHKQ